MILKKLILKNFRAFEHMEIDFEDDITLLIGLNDSGKSSILDALNIFFGGKIDKSDKKIGLTKNEDVEITCCFKGIDAIQIDAAVSVNPEEDFLLKEDGFLHVIKRYKGLNLKEATYLQVENHPVDENDKSLIEYKIDELRSRAKEKKIDDSNINLNISNKIRKALYEGDKGLKKKKLDIDISSSNLQTKGVFNYLKENFPSYNLFKTDRSVSEKDEEPKEAVKGIIKEAYESKKGDFEEPVKQLKEDIQELCVKTKDKLKDISPGISEQLKIESGNVDITKAFSTNILSQDGVPLDKRGSGFRRLILFSFFRVIADKKAQNSFSNIYAIEEPETSQNPRHQIMIFQSLLTLSLQPQRQIILTSHTPLLAKRLPVRSLRFIEVDSDRKRKVLRSDDAYNLAHKTLGILPADNVNLIICVEGVTDREFLIHLDKKKTGESSENSLEKLEEDSKIMFLFLGGHGNLEKHYNQLKKLEKKILVLLDKDKEGSKSKYLDIDPKLEERIYVTDKRDIEGYIHYEAINNALHDWRHQDFVTKTKSRDADEVRKFYLSENLNGEKATKKILKDHLEEKGIDVCEGSIKNLCSLAVEKMTPQRLQQIDSEGFLSGFIEKIKDESQD